MTQYKYTGESEVELPGYGIVKPGEIIETNIVINHPEFEVVSGAQQKNQPEQVMQQEEHVTQQEEPFVTEDN